MTNDCQRFRDRFEPGEPGAPEISAHRLQCADCDHFATLLESALVPSRPRPMPSGLAQRLRAIPSREVTCRDVLRIYSSVRARVHEPRTAPDLATQRHLESCARCRELYGTLESAFRAERRPLSRRLERRLRDIVRRPEQLVPVWIHDTRYAAAACYLIAALSLSTAMEASARLRDTTASLSSTARVWADKGEASSSAAWKAMSEEVDTRFDQGMNSVETFGKSCKKWIADTFSSFESTSRELIPDLRRSVEGDKNDGSQNHGT